MSWSPSVSAALLFMSLFCLHSCIYIYITLLITLSLFVFSEFFTELLDNAKRDLHEMFVRTYGLLYQQNSHVFTDLFLDLRSYYKGKDISLLDALDKFFTTLLQKMFELLNAQYKFDEPYLNCVTEYMEELKPFGDVPQKLSIQVKRAFIAARTFVQGLAIGRDVILAVSKVRRPFCFFAHPSVSVCPVSHCTNYILLFKI